MRAARIVRLMLISAVVLAAGVRPSPAADGLLENSPFLPPASAAGAAGQGSHPLELRGIFRDGDTYEFSIYDTVKKRSQWVTLDEPGRDFMVKAYDAGKQAVTIEQQQQTYVLTLTKAKITPLHLAPGPRRRAPGLPTAGPPRGGTPGHPGFVRPGPNGRAGGGPMRVPRPSTLSPEQLRRLEADINRRRELRRQAAAALEKRQGK